MFQLGKYRLKLTLVRVLLASFCVFQLFSALAPVHIAIGASAPNMINYQGRVLNANGIPVTDSSLNMIFEFYTSVTSGTCVWSNSSATCVSATARSVTLTDGLFSEALGDTSSSYAAIADSIFGDNAAVFLQVTVAGEVLSPRKQIVAAPYALNSDTLDGLDADNDGSTAGAIVALNSTGNAIFTGNPSGSGVTAGSVLIAPSSVDSATNDTIFGIADGATERFRVDKEGDVTVVGDLTTTASTFNLLTGSITTVNAFSATGTLNLGDGTVTSVIDVGGVTSNNATTLNLATNATSADTITIGNSHISTTLALVGGDDWSITTGGVFTLSASTSQTTAIDITDTSYTNSLSIGDNDILGTTAAINFTSFDVGTSGQVIQTMGSPSSGLLRAHVITNGAPTSQTASTEASNIINTAYTRSWATGAITAQREVFLGTPTYAFTGASTITDAANLYIEAAPAAGSNATLTRSYALWADSGNARFDGSLMIGTNVASSALHVDTNAVNTTAILTIENTNGNSQMFRVDATPEAAVTGSVGDLALDTTNGIFYIKGAGGGATTGWLGFATETSNTTFADLTLTGGDIVSSAALLLDVLSTLTLGTDDSLLTSGSITATLASAETFTVAQSGTGSALKLTQSASTGTTVDVNTGGSLHIADTANNDYSLTVYSDTGVASTSPVAIIMNDNTGHDQDVLRIRNDSTAATSSGLVITQDIVADATTAATSQALVINVNEASNSDEVILIVSDADGTPDAEFRFENDGDLFGDGAAYNAGADYAEFFYTLDAKLGDHQLVCQDLEHNLAVKQCVPGDKTVIGVVSVNPGFVGNNLPGAEGSLEGHPNYRIVGLEGQVATYVTASDGAIAVGDALTVSSLTPGYAGKASLAGRVVGFALEPLASGNGQIKVRVSPGWHAGDLLADDGSLTSVGTLLALESLTTANAQVPVSNSSVLAFRGSAWNGSAAEAVSMTLSNKVTSSTSYRLSVANNAGSEVAYINNLGDLVLSGKLYPAGSTFSAQTAAYVYYDSAGMGYMRTNAAGWGASGSDFATMFPSPEVLLPGEVVVFGDEDEQIKRSTGQTYDDRIVGVVSTRPGFLAGAYAVGQSPIAFSGRVPTQVNLENGPIEIGDPLTTSSTPGIAMKATEPGPIVGYAMQPWSAGTGLITVFIRASYYDGDNSIAETMVPTPVSGVGDAMNLSSLNLNGGPLLSVASITGLGNTWRITETGDLVTQGRLVQLIKSYQNEDVETYTAATREMTVQLSGTAILSQNMAVVKFEEVDPLFNDIIAIESPYRVLVTPSGVTGQVYVTDRTTSGFTIRAEHADDDVLVDWLVIAYHKDYEPVPETGGEVVIEETTDSGSSGGEVILQPIDLVPVPVEILEPSDESPGVEISVPVMVEPVVETTDTVELEPAPVEQVTVPVVTVPAEPPAPSE